MTFHRRLAGALLGMVALALAGCAETPNEPNYPEITFQHKPTLNLNVGEIRFVSEFKSPLRPPNVEHELPVGIERSVRRWVNDRLKAVGGSGAYAVFTLKDASVVETPLEKKSGISGFFTNDQSEKYDFRVAGELQIVTINGGRALAIAEATQSTTVPEDATLNERDQVFFQKTELLMREFDVQLEKNIQAFLGAYLK
ncbi:hypothetical protein [Sneathiella limimaris]|uniref:hypothetical protein n=1 Tax=Sneathiella limimaris TaxID=1964213 RepID=UPI001469A55E|nr:hypothetical protein [Sneathiella limimaris]